MGPSEAGGMSMGNHDWPTWQDGKPVQVGEVAMSFIGPLRIDGVVVMDGGWTLLSNQSMFDGAPKWWYVIDSGELGKYEGHPVRPGEGVELWQDGDAVMPDWVFAPLTLSEQEEPSSYESALTELIFDMWHELQYECVRAEDGSNGCLDRMAAFYKRLDALGLKEVR